MRVREIMTRDVVACQEHDTVDGAVEIMMGKDCGCVPVVDEQDRVVGIITDRDICLIVHATNQKPSELFVRGGMAPRVECCKPEDSVDEDRKSTRLNSSHVRISYAVFCLKKKTKTTVAIDRPTTRAQSLKGDWTAIGV